MSNLKLHLHRTVCCLLTLTGLIPLSGCASAASRQEHQTQMESQRLGYHQLLEDIKDGTVTKGLTTVRTKKKYGSPSNVFQSGSTEIWIFRDVKKDDTEDNTTPIRLYFENGKLLVWHY